MASTFSERTNFQTDPSTTPATTPYYDQTLELSTGEVAMSIYTGADNTNESLRIYSHAGVLERTLDLRAIVTTLTSVEAYKVTALSNGNLVVTYFRSANNDNLHGNQDISGQSNGIYFRIIKPDGTPVTAEAQVNQTDPRGDTGNNNLNNHPVVSQLSDGNIAFTWARSDGVSHATRLFTSNGAAVHGEVDYDLQGGGTTANPHAGGTSAENTIAANTDGSYTVSYYDLNNVSFSVFNADGSVRFSDRSALASTVGVGDVLALANGMDVYLVKDNTAKTETAYFINPATGTVSAPVSVAYAIDGAAGAYSPQGVSFNSPGGPGFVIASTDANYNVYLNYYDTSGALITQVASDSTGTATTGGYSKVTLNSGFSHGVYVTEEHYVDTNTPNGPRTVQYYDINPVNTAPVVDLNGAGSGTSASLSYTENGAAAAIAPAATVMDADSANFSGGSLTVSFTANGTSDDQLAIQSQGSITVSGTTVSYNGTAIGTIVNGSDGVNGHALSVAFNANATPTAVTALEQHILYSNSSDNPSTSQRTVTFSVVDGDGTASGGHDTGSATATINVTAVNDAPILATHATGSLAYTENDAATAIVPALTVSDPDSVNLTGATVTFVANHVSGEDVLAFAANANTGNITAAYDDTNGVLTLSGTGTVAQYQAALEAVTYQNTSDDPSTATRTISFTATDGSASATSVTRDITVSAVDDPPTITGAVASQAVDDNATVSPFSQVTIADPDSANLSITVTLDHPTYGALSNLGGGFYDAGAGTYTVSGSAPAVTTALEGLLFTPTGNQTAPGTSETAGFTITVSDGVAPTTTDTTTSVVINSVNDAPTITGASANQTVDDNLTVSPFAVVTIGDVDSPAQTESVTVTLDHPTYGALSNLGGGTYDAGTGTYTISGTAADVTTALQGLVFTPTGNQTAPGTSETAGFTIAVSDGVAAIVSDSTTSVVINSMNDAPTITGAVANQTVDDNLTISPFAVVTIGDVDSPAQTESVTVTLDHPAYGALSNLSGGTYDAGTGTYTISGTAADVTTALQGLVFTPTGNQTAPGTSETAGFTIAVSDGVAASVTDTTTSVVINSVDDAPTGVSFAMGGGTVAEGSASGTVVGALVTSDPDTGDSFTYTLLNDAGGRFALGTGAQAGQIVVANGVLLDYEQHVSHQITVEVSDAAGQTYQTQLTIGVNDVNPESENGNGFSNVLVGGAGDDLFNGLGGADSLVGGAGDDTLNGGTGIDTLVGGAGNDSLVVDQAKDVVVETTGQGTDTVFAAVSYALQAGVSVEWLGTSQQSGTTAIDLTGNALGQVLNGNDGANHLDGRGGGDSLYGHDGNDVYLVRGMADLVFEAAGEGTDTVFATASYALQAGQSVDVLATALQSGTAAIDLTGNTLAQTLHGNDGANYLDGRGGGDALYGHGGDDIYLVRSSADQVFETTGQGSDTIFAKVSYALSAGQSIERLATTAQAGTAAINLTGNDAAQTIDGNDGANVLLGGGGQDTLFGHGGDDTIAGGAGRDTIDTGNGLDVVRFDAVSDSTSTNRDLVLNMNLGGADKFAFTVTPLSIHAPVTTGALNAASFDSDLSAAIHDAGELGAHQAVLFDPSSGNLNFPGHLYLIVDANGVAGYQAGQDYVVELANTSGTLTISDFL